MELLTGNKAKKNVKNLIYEKHQVSEDSVHLTAGKIYRLKTGGDIDFGGSEENASEKEEVEPVKRSPEDKYGWWNLPKGEYLIQFNEEIKLKKGQLGILQPLDRTLKAGAFHPAKFITSETEEPDKVLLKVGEKGFSVKENARISSLLILE